MASRTVAEMKAAHRVLAEFKFDAKELNRGYADRWLRIDIGALEISVHPVTQQMKDLWVGGKGLDLWLTFREIDATTTWQSERNPICFSSGPLGGTTSYPGSGKTLVTAISPMTDSMIDCNVGGYFGPYLKFAGFDALMVTGKSSQEVIAYIDAVNHKVTIETAPEESIDSHVLAEELTEMYAEDRLDRRNVSVVAAGRAAQHTRFGVLNFSFYDWRRRVPRLKQAGRGGVGTVFRDKGLKALVIRNRGITPAWRIAESKVSLAAATSVCDDCGTDVSGVRESIARYSADPNRLLDMLQDIQDANGFISRAAIDEISHHTGQTLGLVYELATFWEAFTLEKRPNGGGPRVREELADLVLRQLFAPGEERIFEPDNVRAYLAPGAWGLLADLFEKTPAAEVTRAQVSEVVGGTGAFVVADGSAHCHVEVLRDEVAADARHSCGACTPCREGLPAIVQVLTKIVEGHGTEADRTFVRTVAETVGATSLCAFGKHAAEPILGALETCEEEFDAHLAGREVQA